MYTQAGFHYDVPRPERLSRLLIFVKWLMILPHAFILYFYGIVAAFVGFLAWWAILFTGVYPQGMWNLVYGYVRWNARVSVYTTLLRDEYPPFGEEPYPLQFHVERPERSSRLLLLGRFFLLIPLGLWMSLVGLYASVLMVIAFITILVTGNIPESIFYQIVGVMRYIMKVNCFAYLLTDDWPGFAIT